MSESHEMRFKEGRKCFPVLTPNEAIHTLTEALWVLELENTASVMGKTQKHCLKSWENQEEVAQRLREKH